MPFLKKKEKRPGKYLPDLNAFDRHGRGRPGDQWRAGDPARNGCREFRTRKELMVYDR